MTSTQKNAASEALLALLDATVALVKASGPMGKPGGELYAFLMTYGCNIQQFEQFMSVLVDAGKLEKRGQLYFTKESK
jgi:hypothetical protein